MIEVHFSKGEIEEAYRFDQEQSERKEGLKSRIDGTKFNNYIGYLGELAVKKYFQAIGCSFDEPNEEYGRHKGDSCDFIVSSKKVDVKTSKRYQYIMLNEKQYWKTLRKNITYIVGVYLQNEVAIVIGYAYPSQLREREEKYQYEGKEMKMYFVPFEEIHEFKENNIIIW